MTVEPLGELEHLILVALVRLGPEAYGVPIVDELSRHTRRPVLRPSVYLALRRLEQKGFVRSRLGDPERPLLRFAEDACVQCGLCQATCPEKVITLKPQLDFRAATASARVLKEEPPFACIRCGKPFGVKSTIERVAAKLEGKHWMYSGAARRLDVVKMCEDCRVTVVSEEDFDPYGSPPRQPVRWRNPNNGRYGEVVAEDYYDRGGYRCRNFVHRVFIEGREQVMRGTACRNADGTWRNVA